MVSLITIFFISGYQQFNLDKVLMERLYSQEIVKDSGKNERSDKEEFLQRIANRQPYSFNYCSYRCTTIFNTFYCCFKCCLSERAE